MILGLVDKNFKTLTINMLKDLKQTMNEYEVRDGNLKQNIKTIKRAN